MAVELLAFRCKNICFPLNFHIKCFPFHPVIIDIYCFHLIFSRILLAAEMYEVTDDAREATILSLHTRLVCHPVQLSTHYTLAE